MSSDLNPKGEVVWRNHDVSLYHWRTDGQYHWKDDWPGSDMAYRVDMAIRASLVPKTKYSSGGLPKKG